MTPEVRIHVYLDTRGGGGGGGGGDITPLSPFGGHLGTAPWYTPRGRICPPSPCCKVGRPATQTRSHHCEVMEEDSRGWGGASLV